MATGGEFFKLFGPSSLQWPTALTQSSTFSRRMLTASSWQRLGCRAEAVAHARSRKHRGSLRLSSLSQRSGQPVQKLLFRSEEIIRLAGRCSRFGNIAMSSEDTELHTVELQFPLIRGMSRSDSTCTAEDRIMTDTGSMLVAVHGDKNKPAIFTYHDIGLNHVTNFLAFFNHLDTKVLMQSFCVYHINAPGQDEDSSTLPQGYTFPTLDTLAEMVLAVLEHYGLKHFIGFGVGAGANILARFALLYPHCVDGLFLINCTSTAAGWTEWGYQKLNTMYLRNSGMTQSTEEYLMWHHFGKTTEDRSYDLIQLFRHYFKKSVNPTNLGLFIDSFIRRTDLQIVRETDPSKKRCVRNFRCHVLLMSGAFSPHLEDTVTMNGRLDPSNSTWMKLSDCGMPLEERPNKVREALFLFLQGLGYAVNQYRRRSSAASTSNEAFKVLQAYRKSLDYEANQLPSPTSPTTTTTYVTRQEVHIVENPINQHTGP